MITAVTQLTAGLRVAIFLLAALAAAGCASTQVSHTAGRHLQDTIQPGSVLRTDYHIHLDPPSASADTIRFRLEFVQQRQRGITPHFEEIQVAVTRDYAPNLVELVFDALLLPLIIVFNVTDHDFAGYRTCTARDPTGRSVAGATRHEGLLAMPAEPVAGEPIEVRINRESVGEQRTDTAGRFPLPAQALVEAYLIEERCRVSVTGPRLGFTANCDIPKPFLEDLLNRLHSIPWR